MRALAVAVSFLSGGPLVSSCRPRAKERAQPTPAAARFHAPARNVPTPEWPSEVLYGCVDTAAVELKARLIERTAPGEGRIRIDGVVQNLGTVAWKPWAPKNVLAIQITCDQSVPMAVVPPNWPGYRGLDRLLPGERATVSLPIDWNPAMRRAGRNCTLRISDEAARSATRDCKTGPKTAYR